MANSRIFLLFGVLMTFMFTSVYAQELGVTLNENLGAQAEGDGMYVAYYNITSGKVSIIVNNSNSNYMSDENDTSIADIWIPINDSHSTLLYFGCRINATSTTDSILSNTTNYPCAAQICKITSSGLSDCFCLGNGAPTQVNKTQVLNYNENLNGTSNYDYVIHINNLNGSKQATIVCDLNTTVMQNNNQKVFSFAERYTPTKIVNNGCTNVDVNLNITNEYSSSCNISATIQKRLATRGTGTSWSNLTFNSADGATINNTANGAYAQWDNVIFEPEQTHSFNFTIKACPNMTGNTSKLEMGRVHISFNLANSSCANETRTGLKVGHVSAVGPGKIEPQKGYNGTFWNETSIFYNTAADLNYTVYSMRVWATNGTTPPANPNDASISGSEWANCLAGTSYLANGSSVSCNGVKSFQFNGTPVVWARSILEVTHGGDRGWQSYIQFGNSKNASKPLGSNYMFIEKIWVINDYLIRTTKKVVPTSQPGCYNISINVTNLGPTCSPYVYIYDIVPPKFNESISNIVVFNDSQGTGVFNNNCDSIAKPGNAVSNVSQGYLLSFADPSASETWNLVNCPNTFNKSQYTGKQVLGGNYSGTGYYWRLFPLAGSNSGGECVNNKYTNLENMSVERSVIISYTTCASPNATYYASDLFIVGVDPKNVEGNAAPPLSGGINISSQSLEILLIILIIIIAGIYIYKNKIERK